MELCKLGDVEEYLKEQVGKAIPGEECKIMMFQMAFSLFAAKEQLGLMHYDVKNLNFLLQDGNAGNEEGSHSSVCLEYSLGDDVYGVNMERSRAVILKLADYGTSDMKAKPQESTIGLGNFTTLENSPPEFMILGERCKQGHDHDNFGLGLCMFHLFSGNAPYEEILEDVKCGPSLKSELSRIWEDERDENFGVIRSLINAEVYDEGDEKDFTLHDTLYRFIVLFGRPKNFGGKEAQKVFQAIDRGLEGDEEAFEEHSRLFNLDRGINYIVAAAREKLESVPGAMRVLKGLVRFDPQCRINPYAVLTSEMMKGMRKSVNESQESQEVLVKRYTHFKGYVSGKVY